MKKKKEKKNMSTASANINLLNGAIPLVVY